MVQEWRCIISDLKMGAKDAKKGDAAGWKRTWPWPRAVSAARGKESITREENNRWQTVCSTKKKALVAIHLTNVDKQPGGATELV